MRRVLVVHASRNGSTAEIAEAIADELRDRDIDADCMGVDAAPRHVTEYDAVVLGSAVYAGRWLHEARRFLRRHRDDLAAMPFWVFSSGPVGEGEPDPKWLEPARVMATAEHLGVRAHVVFGGRVPEAPHNFVERAMKRDTPADAADRRDWAAIRGWAAEIAAALATVPQPR